MNIARLCAAATVLAVTAMHPSVASADQPQDRLAQMEAEVASLRAQVARGTDRGQIENLFSRYMYLHSAFRDPEIIPLWVAKGTADVHAQYSNNGVYTDWDKIMSYHAQRPAPRGKLTLHYLTSPIIEVAADGQTAKGMWTMAGVESGLTSLEAAKSAPDFMYEKTLVDGKKVWMHNVVAKYGIDFLKQDGVWKIWHFHCYDVYRSPVGMGWIPFAAQSQNNAFSDDLMYFGEDGKPVLMPKPDAPATVRGNPYRTDTSQSLDAVPPVPYGTFKDTFSY